MVSLYYFWKNLARSTSALHCRLLDEDLTLMEFASDPESRNLVTRFFLDGVDLESFFFIGVQEHYAEDFRELTSRLGWTGIEPRFDNRNTQPGYDAILRGILDDREMSAKLLRLNQDDMDVYQTVLRLRADRLRDSLRPAASPWTRHSAA
jgi:hypothetical protein